MSAFCVNLDQFDPVKVYLGLQKPARFDNGEVGSIGVYRGHFDL